MSVEARRRKRRHGKLQAALRNECSCNRQHRVEGASVRAEQAAQHARVVGVGMVLTVWCLGINPGNRHAAHTANGVNGQPFHLLLMGHHRQWRMQRYTEKRKPYEKAASEGHG